MNKYRIQITQTFEFLGEIQEKKVIYKNVKEKNKEIALFKVGGMFEKDELFFLRLFVSRFINTKRDLFTSEIKRELNPLLFERFNRKAK